MRTWYPVSVMPLIPSRAIVYITSHKKMGVLNPKSTAEEWKRDWEFYVSKYNISFWAYQHLLIDYFEDELGA